MSDTVRVWRVTPHPAPEYDSIITDSVEHAGQEAARLAEWLWDDNEGPASEPGPAVTIQVYEMSRQEYDALTKDE